MIKKIVVILIYSSILLCFVSDAFTKDINIGVIMSSNIPYFKEIHKTLTAELEAKNIKTEMIIQTPSPDIMAWTNAARKINVIGVDAIVTYGTPSTQAVLSEYSNIPVVFAGVYDHNVLDTKGKKVGGILSKVSVAGLLKNLKDIYNFSTLGIVYSTLEKETILQVAEAERLGGQFSFKLSKINVKSRDDIFNIKNVDAIFVTTSSIAATYIDEIVSIGRSLKITVVTIMGGMEEKGVLLSLYSDPNEQGREVSELVTYIIRKNSLSSSDIRNPRKLNFVINLKEANRLGVKIPFDILTHATKVVK